MPGRLSPELRKVFHNSQLIPRVIPSFLMSALRNLSETVYTVQRIDHGNNLCSQTIAALIYTPQGIK